MFEAGKKMAQRAMGGRAKDDLIAEKIFELFSSRGFSSKKGLRGRGEGDYHYRKFESPIEGLKAVEVKVSRSGTGGLRSGGIEGTIGDLAKTLGPQRARIEFELVYKEGGFLGRGKESKRFEFSVNSDEYIDDELKVKDEAAFQRLLDGYLKSMGFPSG